jgi:protein-disulfide isomerase
MERLLLALGIAVVAAVVALALRRRSGSDAPTQSTGRIPEQLDRADFAEPDKPWLVVVFASATCDACADVRSKAEVLATNEVSVAVSEYPRDKAVHDRYRIDAVPLVVIADARGVVRKSFLGPVTATDLWAGVAAAREPSE